MSHVADALRRTLPNAAVGDVLRDDDHPWREQLDARTAGSREDRWTLADPPHDDGGAVRADRPPRPTVAPVPESPFVPTAPLDTPAGRGSRQQIAGLVERVFMPVSGPAPRVVAFATVDPDDSSGRIAAASAEVLSQRTGARVVVVDLNFGRPSIHECFAVPQAPGLAEALHADTPLVGAARQVHGNLWVVPTGNVAAHGDLSAGSRSRLAHLASAFDYVVMTFEPLTDCFGTGLAGLADGLVLVVNAESTRRETGRMVVERLQSSGASVLGAVLTNRRYPIPEAIYRRL